MEADGMGWYTCPKAMLLSIQAKDKRGGSTITVDSMRF